MAKPDSIERVIAIPTRTSEDKYNVPDKVKKLKDMGASERILRLYRDDANGAE